MENLSEEEKVTILLKITKELIINSKTEKTRELEKKLTALRELEKIRKPVRTFPINQPVNRTPPLFRQQIPRTQVYPQNQRASREQPTEQQPVFNLEQKRMENAPRLVIPEVNLPERFQYLKPTPTREEINLGKLNPLIKDPNVKEIQCDGPGKEIIVKAPMPKKTPIVLNEQEIKEIFLAFSKVAKIPAEENIVKIAVANLILNGINSSVIDSKFIIRKMTMPGFGQ